MRLNHPLASVVRVFSLLALLLTFSGFTPTNLSSVQAAPAAQEDIPSGESVLVWSAAPNAPDVGLQAILNQYLDGLQGDWSAVVKKLDTGQYAAYKPDSVMVSASLYKIYVLYTLMQEVKAGNISLDDKLTITEADAAEDQAIDNLAFDVGSQHTIAYLANRMIEVSDNTAATALTYKLTVDKINQAISSLGLKGTSLNFSGGDNMTSAADVSKLFELVATGQAVSRQASAQMLDLYLNQTINNLIPDGVTVEIPVAHKTGSLYGLRHDAGIVYGKSGPYVITLMASNLDDSDKPYTVMPYLSKAIYEYLNNRPYQPSRYFPETQFAVGPSFLLFYNSHGAENAFGLPISAESQQSGIVYQYFERGRLERPVDGSGPVGLGRIGAELASKLGKSFAPATRPDADSAGVQWFADTRQVISEPFLDFWNDHGGAAILGLPLSGVLSEKVGGAGPYSVQYFERARLELHGSQVELGQVGSELLAAQ